MAVSDKLQVYWFNPMRAATRSTLAVQQYLNFKDTWHTIYPKSSNYRLISNIRNPYARTVSLFHFFFRGETKTIEDFKRYVPKKINEQKNFRGNIQDIQFNLTEIFEETNKFPEYLIKVESLYDDIMNIWFVKDNVTEGLLKVMNESILTNHYYQEYGSRPSWKDHYDDETAEMLYEYLKKDFELGNYDKNSWKDGAS